MPDLGQPLVKEVRRLAAAYAEWPGPDTARPSEVLEWHSKRVADDEDRGADEASAQDSSPEVARATRRQVLGGIAAVGAAGALTAMGSASAAAASKDAPKVVVIGAGLGGLSCTYRLRQNGIKAVLYEPQERLGGRCWSLTNFFENGQTAEHGGQYVDSRHTQLRALAAELGVGLIDTHEQHFPSGDQGFRWIKGELRTSDEVFAGFGGFYRKLKHAYERAGDYHWNKAGAFAKQFDNMTIIEYLDKVLDGGANSVLGHGIQVGEQSFFGMEPGEMSAINLWEAYVAPYPGANERYRIAGGNDQLVKALVAAIPDGAIRRGELVAARTRSDGRVELVLDGVSGNVVADRVVMALPFTVLRDLDTSQLDVSARRRKAINELAMGTNSKFNMQLNTSLKSLDWTGGFSSDVPHYVTWDTTYGQVTPHPRTPVVTIYNGGIEGTTYPAYTAHAPATARAIDSVLANLGRGIPNIANAFNGLAHLDQWFYDPYVHGSYAGFGPGQYTDYWGFLAKREGNVFFAGEHTSTHSQGYLNGGVESGERAALQVLHSLG
jgi:monoamine oxidase